jgi:hypothetical protein
MSRLIGLAIQKFTNIIQWFHFWICVFFNFLNIIIQYHIFGISLKIGFHISLFYFVALFICKHFIKTKLLIYLFILTFTHCIYHNIMPSPFCINSMFCGK